MNICNDCYLIRNENNDLEADELDESKSCPICFKLYQKGNRIELIGCSHKFCKDCISIWKDKNDSCPTCRAKFIKFKKKTPRSYFTFHSFDYFSNTCKVLPTTLVTSSRLSLS